MKTEYATVSTWKKDRTLSSIRKWLLGTLMANTFLLDEAPKRIIHPAHYRCPVANLTKQLFRLLLLKQMWGEKFWKRSDSILVQLLMWKAKLFLWILANGASAFVFSVRNSPVMQAVSVLKRLKLRYGFSLPNLSNKLLAHHGSGKVFSALKLSDS